MFNIAIAIKLGSKFRAIDAVLTTDDQKAWSIVAYSTGFSITVTYKEACCACKA